MKVRRENLSDQAYSILREKIFHLRFSPGRRINVEEVAREIGVSRTPVWEAIRRLEQEGLVYCVPKKGVFLQEADSKIIMDLYSVRAMLEAYAGRSAALNRGDEQLKEMESLLLVQEKIVMEKDLQKYSLLDFDFHLLVARMSGNNLLEEILKNLMYKARAMRIEPILLELYFDHVKLFEAIKAGDSVLAERVLTLHNEKVAKEALRNLENPDRGRMRNIPDKGVGEKI